MKMVKHHSTNQVNSVNKMKNPELKGWEYANEEDDFAFYSQRVK